MHHKHTIQSNNCNLHSLSLSLSLLQSPQRCIITATISQSANAPHKTMIHKQNTWKCLHPTAIIIVIMLTHQQPAPTHRTTRTKT
jgi:hypothetical protein